MEWRPNPLFRHRPRWPKSVSAVWLVAMVTVLAWQIAVAHYVAAAVFVALCVVAVFLQMRALRAKR